jgi:hypothetical protein
MTELNATTLCPDKMVNLYLSRAKPLACSQSGFNSYTDLPAVGRVVRTLMLDRRQGAHPVARLGLQDEDTVRQSR